MTHHRSVLAMIGMFMFVVLGRWPGQAAAQVNIDVGGVHVQVGDRPPPPMEVVAGGLTTSERSMSTDATRPQYGRPGPTKP